jgi:hypothetical protein
MQNLIENQGIEDQGIEDQVNVNELEELQGGGPYVKGCGYYFADEDNGDNVTF